MTQAEFNDPKVKTRLDYIGNGLWAVYRGEEHKIPEGCIKSSNSIDELMDWCLTNGHANVVLSPTAKICVSYERKEKAFYTNKV
jgi:hypothetical protein